MKYSFFAACAFGVVFLVSCGQNEGGGARVQTTPAPALSLPANPVLPGNKPAAPIVSTGKVNPAHGQPGHRCDLAVGAPLPVTTSLPAFNPAAVTPAPAQNPVATPTPVVQPQASIAATATGMNPAHGQPGHRCDIPVGQPLNSAPAKPQTTTTTASPTVTTTPTVDTTPDTMLAKGLNPAHGKPGHRCDIAVGQPLTTPAKTATKQPG